MHSSLALLANFRQDSHEWMVHMRRLWTVSEISVGLAGAEALVGQKVDQQLINKLILPEFNLLINC